MKTYTIEIGGGAIYRLLLLKFAPESNMSELNPPNWCSECHQNDDGDCDY